MKLATIRDGNRTRAVRIEGDEAIDLGVADVGEILAKPQWQTWVAKADEGRRPAGELDFAPLIPRPGKIICVGLNYRDHIVETGLEVPTHPTLFAKFTPSLIGANDDIVLPAASQQVDWEAELAVIIGQRVRHADEKAAAAAIGGYTILNDVSVRDFQMRTLQWLQGKTFESSTPLGPYLVTPDESPGPGRDIRCEIDGEVMQHSNTWELAFTPIALVAYISSILTLEPGDVISTGTPGGVGLTRTPPRFLRPGEQVVTRIEGLGECRNRCRREIR